MFKEQEKINACLTKSNILPTIRYNITWICFISLSWSIPNNAYLSSKKLFDIAQYGFILHLIPLAILHYRYAKMVFKTCGVSLHFFILFFRGYRTLLLSVSLWLTEEITLMGSLFFINSILWQNCTMILFGYLLLTSCGMLLRSWVYEQVFRRLLWLINAYLSDKLI